MAHDNAPSMAVVMMTAFGSIETAVEALKMGAYDYVTKPFKIDELRITSYNVCYTKLLRYFIVLFYMIV